LGLSPVLVDEVFRAINDIKSAGTTVLMVEQNAEVALSLADRAVVMQTGEVIFEDEAAVLRGDMRVRGAYLGDQGASPVRQPVLAGENEV